MTEMQVLGEKLDAVTDRLDQISKKLSRFSLPVLLTLVYMPGPDYDLPFIVVFCFIDNLSL